MDYIKENVDIRFGLKKKKARLIAENNFFSGKIQKKSDFILNSGNSYVTLQLELCPYVSCKQWKDNSNGR